MIPGPGRSSGEGIGYPLLYFGGFPCGSAGKEYTCSSGDLDPIPGLGIPTGEGKGYPLQYPGLENSRNCIVLWFSGVQIQTRTISPIFLGLQFLNGRLWDFSSSITV